MLFYEPDGPSSSLGKLGSPGQDMPGRLFLMTVKCG